ncbi:311_t:CDS:10, partial [Funneliformis geosporum]
MPNDKTEKNKELELRLNEFSGVITKSGSILIKLNSGKTLEEAITDLINENIKLKKKVKELEDEKIDKVKWMELLKEVLGKENFDENGKYKGAASTATQQPATSPSQTQKPGSTAKEDPGFSIDDAKTVYDNGWRNITNKYSSEGQTSEGIDQKKHQKGEIEKVHKLLNKIDKQTDLSNLPKDSQINIITYDENKVPSSINYANVKKNRDDKKLKLFRNVFEGNNPPTPRINDDDLKNKGKQNYEGLAVKVLFHNKEEIDKVNNLIKEINSKKNFKELDEASDIKDNGEGDIQVTNPDDSEHPLVGFDAINVDKLTLGQTAWREGMVGGSAEASDIQNDGSDNVQVIHPTSGEKVIGYDKIIALGDKSVLKSTSTTPVTTLPATDQGKGGANTDQTAVRNNSLDNAIMDDWFKKTKTGGGSILDDGRQKEDVEWKFKVKRSTFSYFLNEPYNEVNGVSTAKIINQFLQDNEVEFTDEKGNKITTSDPNKVEDMTPWLIGLGGFDTTKEDENEKCGFDPENPEFCEVGNPQKGLLPIGTGVGKTTKTVACLCNGGQKNAVLVCPNKGLAQSAYDNHSSWLQKWGCVYHKFNRRIVEEEVVKVDEKTVVLNDVIISKKKLADKDEKDNDIPGTEKLRWGVSIMDPGHFDGFLTRAVWNKQRFQDPSDNNKTKIAPNLLKPYGPTGKEKGTELVPNVTADTVKEIKTKKIPDDVIILFDEAHLTFNSTYRELFEDAIELGYNVLKMSATFPGKPFSITTTFPRKNLYMNYLPESYKNSDGEVVDFNAQLAKSRIGIFLKDVVNKEVIEDKKNKKTIIKENSLVTKVLSDENIPYVIINETNQKFFETITSGMPDGSVVIIDNSREMGYTPNFDIIICSASMVQQIGRVARIMNGTAIILSKKTQEPKTEILDRKGNKIEDVAVHVVRAALMGNMDSLKEISFGKNLNLLRAAISLPGDCDNEDDKTGKFGLPPEVLIVGAAGTQTASYVKPTFHRELTTFNERETREILKMMVQTYINKDKEFPKQLHTTVISSLIGQLYDGSDPKNKGRGLGQFKLEVEDVEKIFHTVMKDKLAEIVDIYRLVLGTKVDIPWRDIDPDDPNKGKNLVVELKYPAPIGKRAIFLESEEEKQLKSKIKFILEAANLNIFDEVKEVLERDTLEGYDILAIELRTSPLCNKLIDAIGTNRANKVVYELEQLMRNLEQLQTNIGVNTASFPIRLLVLEKDLTIAKSFKDIQDSSWDKVIFPNVGTIITDRRVFKRRGWDHRVSVSFTSAISTVPHTSVTNYKIFTGSEGRYEFSSYQAWSDTVNTFNNSRGIFTSYDTIKNKPIRGFLLLHTINSVLNDAFYVSGKSENFTSIIINGKEYYKMKKQAIFNYIKKYSVDSFMLEITYPAGVEFDAKEFEGVAGAKFVAPGGGKPAGAGTPGNTPSTPNQGGLTQADKDKLLASAKNNAKQKLADFYLKTLGIDNTLIEEKYKDDKNWTNAYGMGFNLDDIIDKYLTLENEKDAKKAFRVVACICATEKIEQLNETYKNFNPKPARFLKAISKVNDECKRVVENLVQENQLQASQLQPLKTENSTTISIKREDLSIEKTVFQILKEGGGNKNKAETYLNWLKKEYPSEGVADLNELVQRTRETVVNDLKTAKENYKTKRPDGQPWALPLTKAEKDKIDEAANKDDLDDVAKKIKEEQDKNNISNKTKPEELITTEQDIDKELGSKKLPPGFKDNVKLTLLAKQINLLPEPTDVLGKIKKHLMDTKYNWRKWEYLIDNEKTDDEDYTVASMYNQTFRKEVAEHVLPKIEVAINTNTIEGYKNLDKEWSGEANIDKKSEVNYNLKRDYFGAWIILRSLLKETTNKKESLDDLKNLAKDALGLSIEDNKTPDQVITVITDEIKKLKQSNDDIKEKFPD